METGFANDPHSERGHFCPKNVFGYADYRILQPIEAIRQLALQAGHPVSWSGFKQQEMIHASILSHTKGDNSELAAILEAALLSTRGLTL